MQTIQELHQHIETFLANQPFRRTPASLYEPVCYTMAQGGKRIRPTLAMLAYNLYKEDPQSIISPAMGLETYHNYTLLHDDLMDQAEMRRGKPTVHKKWDANTAILSGDSMLVLAYQCLLAVPDSKLPAIMQLFTTTALEIGEGQQYDMDFEQRNDVTEAEYIEMIRLKTSVLLACALKIGAILADAPAEDADNLYRFGEMIGLAFQLQDDFLDVYGDPKVFGKTVGGDIMCNKKTYMLINACNQANARQQKELQHWLNIDHCDKEQKVSAVTALYNEIGIDRMAQEKIAFYFEHSKKYLEAVRIPDSRKAVLRTFVEDMMKRKY